jgi:hypothetical protein
MRLSADLRSVYRQATHSSTFEANAIIEPAHPIGAGQTCCSGHALGLGFEPGEVAVGRAQVRG